MDSQDDSQATQQATQNALDPRRLGKQNSGFSDEDIADIVCLLYPNSENASLEVQRMAISPEYRRYITGKYTAAAIDSDLALEDDAREFGRPTGLGDHAIILRLSAGVKHPELGFTFGRNASRCDFCFRNDPAKRLSNIHFRIYVNEYGVVMLEDRSTNGTIVDDCLLKRRHNKDGQEDNTEKGDTMRALQSGSTIKIFMEQNVKDYTFIVRIPRREGELEEAYNRNLRTYRQKMSKSGDDLERTIVPGPTGRVNLFSPPRLKHARQDTVEVVNQINTERLPREWRGGEKYNRVRELGRGAFATVYLVTSKYDGLPYAAKELDKRKFMKNGVLDQKVENEMKIMQRIRHPNIVQFIEHLDVDANRLVIIMEYVPGSDLGKLVAERGTIPESGVRVVAQQLTDALGYLHGKKITHRDVKPDNILVNLEVREPLVKLTDFGLSKVIDTEQTFLKTFCGTLLYCAPEVYSEYSTFDDNGHRVRPKERSSNRERYGHLVDVWSLGGVLFYALTGSPPFPAKNGIGYMELLQHIMTHPLNTRPLMKAGVSTDGIRFLTRMIDRRPESRATIAELRLHPWLTEQADDEVSDDELLEHRASQLSVLDKEPDHLGDSMAADDLDEPEPNLSDIIENKENYTFGHARPNRLWGEVNHSAFGSSGAIAEDRLNLPMPANGLDETQLQDSDVLDSFESDDLSTPRQKPRQPRSVLGPSTVASNMNTPSFVSGDRSESLEGASSIMEHLNVKSVARTDRSATGDFTASKRAHDTSDEFENTSLSVKPSFKRLKSKGEGGLWTDDEEDDFELIASVPQVVKSDSGRQLDYPVHKATFWDAADKKSWHLDYPEMTSLQHDAFMKAASLRNEEFAPGKTPLWDLAMRCFPPTRRGSNEARNVPESRPLLRRDSRCVRDNEGWDRPPTADRLSAEDVSDSARETPEPDSQFFVPPPPVLSPKQTVARLASAFGSLVTGISISLSDPVLSWGRAADNTEVYKQPLDTRISKYAFRILLWKERSALTSSEFRPWEQRRSPSPEPPESWAFYISTKATNGLRVNESPLDSNAPKDLKAPSRYWMKLHHGDELVLYENDAGQIKLTFECFWGASSALRPIDEPPTCVPEPTARKLDNAWTKAEKSLYNDRATAEATKDQQDRMKDIGLEQARSKLFETKRAQAVRILASRAKQRDSPSPAPSLPPNAGRTVPRFRHGSPAAVTQ